MDTLLENGEHVQGATGLPITISGGQATRQRLMIRLAADRGKFAPYPQLGSRLFEIKNLPEHERERAAFDYAVQALLPERARVEEVVLGRDTSGRLWVSVIASLAGQEYRLEVGV